MIEEFLNDRDSWNSMIRNTLKRFHKMILTMKEKLFIITFFKEKVPSY